VRTKSILSAAYSAGTAKPQIGYERIAEQFESTPVNQATAATQIRDASRRQGIDCAPLKARAE
jgi:hypothetical protein